MRVAIFGAGYAGLALARRLERTLPPDVELVVVDESGTHVVRHLLHRAIRTPDAIQSLSSSLETLLEGASVRAAHVETVDPEAGVATLADGETLTLDVGALCLGPEPAFNGLEGIREHASTLHRPADAEQIRAGFLDALDAEGRVIIGGGGLTGVQIAGELAELAAERDAADHVELTLLEQAEAVPPDHDDRIQRAVTDALTAAGVTVETGVTVTGVTDGAVAVDEGEPKAYNQLVWAGGIRGPSAIGGDRASVPATVRHTANVFALGDAARVIDDAGRAVPATAQAAVQQADTAAHNITRLVDHRRSDGTGFEPRFERYRHSEPGWTISVGDRVVAEVGPALLTGRPASLAKRAITTSYLANIGAIADAVEPWFDPIST